MHDLRGLYAKFRVIRNATGEEVPSPTFTLCPTDDPHARAAMSCYADSCERENPDLAADLREVIALYS